MGIRMLIGLVAILGLGGCWGPIVVHPNATGGGSCAGVAERGCLPGEFCDLQVGQCHVQQVAGVCVPRPEACTRDYRPVCGCNGTTYGNDCERIAAGVQKVHDGACGAATCPNEGHGCPHAKQGCPYAEHGCPHAGHGCPHAKQGCPHAKHACPHSKQACPHESPCPYEHQR
jgi:Kazal-type serine protease inhibitor-like protein